MFVLELLLHTLITYRMSTVPCCPSNELLMAARPQIMRLRHEESVKIRDALYLLDASKPLLNKQPELRG